MHEDEGSTNKRKLVDPLFQNPVNTPPSLTEFPPYKSLEESQNLQSDTKARELPPRFVPEQWDGILIRQLEDLLLENLTSIFQDAIKHIVECGYSDAVARRAISRNGLYNEGEDLVLNIVNDAVAFLQKGRDVDSISIVDRYRDFAFENLQQLSEYTLLEMVNVLKEIKPSLSTVESMWWLLLCDLNISQACAIEEREILNGCLSSIYRKFSSLPVSSSFFEDQRCKPRYFNPSVPSGFTSSTSVAQHCPPEALKFGSLPKSPDNGNPLSNKLQASEKKISVSVPGNSKRIPSDTASQTSFSKEKLNISRKVLNKKEYASRQKSILEKFTQLATDSGKSAGTFGFVMEKRLKPQSDCVDTSSPDSKTKSKAEAPSADKIHHVSTNISTATSAANEPPIPKARIKITTKAEAYGPPKARIKITTSKPGANSPAFSDISAVYEPTKARVKVTTSKPEASVMYQSPKASVKVTTSRPGANSLALSDISAACESPKARVKVTTSKPEASSPALPDKSAAHESPKACMNVTTSKPEANSSVLPDISATLESPKEHMKVTTSNPEANSPTFPDICDYYAQIPYDKSQGIYVPRDEKDEIILKLLPRVQKLQNELCSWTEWANQKVMQAAHRLMKEKPELNSLRQEKEEVEKFKREKQMLDENTTKRLSEMEAAVNNATGQVDKANITVEKLGVENNLLKKELIASKLFAAQSEAKYQEALEREKAALKNAQLWEQQKTMFQEDLAMKKTKVTELHKKADKAKGLRDQIEARLKQEMMAKETWNAQAASLKAQREQFEAAAKEEESIIAQKAETDVKRHEEDIIKLENEISAMNFKFDALRIAALRKSIDGVYGTNDSNVANPGSNAFKMIGDFQDSFGNEDLSLERECVMCLSNEMSVVFLPCAHMVLCTTCNELHEKQGMGNCPSCRTVIDRRIPVRFSSSMSSIQG